MDTNSKRKIIVKIKKIISRLTGYWIHRNSTLPIGVDLFHDICERFHFRELRDVFDVGANIGQTYRWIRHYQPDARIYCFEPVASVFRELEKNVSELGGDYVVEHIAFSDQRGEKTVKIFEEMSVLNSLNDDLMNRAADAKEETICMETIDDYCAKRNIERIDFLKIDTEGYELNVLKGASNMLKENRVVFIYCECGFLRANNRNTYFSDLCEFLSERGYLFYGLYQVSDHNWHRGMNFGNALFVNVSLIHHD